MKCKVDTCNVTATANGFCTAHFNVHEPAFIGPPKPDMINHPPHYNSHPSGVECITVVEHMNYCRGNAMKYIWRAGEKGGPEQELEDLKKARWYLDREIQRVEKSHG